MNGAYIWIETGLAVMELAKRSASLTEMVRHFGLAETSFETALEDFSMPG